ncbi:uncharacterized protein [Dermacentor andersoni]|uniref:uncharacterized protein isoform X2 n=1 Tax=Dermacentor andersoni TaxID=34620 RepID=UPI002154FF94|nr:uncharacterized protein LOC126548481 isoform X2 [Dermacentor andersoni]
MLGRYMCAPLRRSREASRFVIDGRSSQRSGEFNAARSSAQARNPVLRAVWLVPLLSCCCWAGLALGALPALAEGGVGPLWRVVSSSSYYIADVSFPQPRSRRAFVPSPPYCPETGRTVCAQVDDYPTDYIYHVLLGSKSKHFNLSTLFSDERLGDSQPNRALLPDQPRTDSFVVYQTAVHYDYDQQGRSPHHQGGQHRRPPPRQHRRQQQQHQEPQFHHHQPPHQDGDDWADTTIVLPPTFVYHKRDLVKRAPEVDPACPVRTMFVSPKAGLSDRSQWKYVVNLQDRDPSAKQVIRVDVCRSPDTACSNAISLPFGYTSRCTQKYLKKKLLSLDSDGSGTSEENFFVPSCCVCELVRDVGKK